MHNDTYLTIKSPSEGFYKDKGSKFIALTFPVESELEVATILENAKKQYHDARHHCFAYAIGQNRESYRLNDDGEPSGTAGKPIFGQLLAHNLTNTLVVVVRYFGGTKLGTRGLIDAYRTATANAIDNATTVTKVICTNFKVLFDYVNTNDVMKVLKEHDLHQYGLVFDNQCQVCIMVRNSIIDKVLEELERIPTVLIENSTK